MRFVSDNDVASRSDHSSLQSLFDDLGMAMLANGLEGADHVIVRQVRRLLAVRVFGMQHRGCRSPAAGALSRVATS